MSSFHRLLNRIGAFFDVLDAAISASASIRAHRSPADRDLSRLGIKADRATIAAMAQY